MTNSSSKQVEPELKVHALTVFVCQDCIDLKGEMCNNAECVFCRRTMAEVREYLDVMLLCPIVDGKRLILVGDAVTNEDTRVPVNQSVAPRVDETPSDVDNLLFRLAAKDCERLAAGMNDCTEDLPFADWCVICQSRGLIQKYSRAAAPLAPKEEAIDAERLAASIVALWRTENSDDQTLVRYIKQTLLGVRSSATPPAPLVSDCDPDD